MCCGLLTCAASITCVVPIYFSTVFCCFMLTQVFVVFSGVCSLYHVCFCLIYFSTALCCLVFIQVSGVSFHPAGTHLITGSGDKTVKVW